MTSIACKGDVDTYGFMIVSGCDESVTVNGRAVALQGSMLNDGSVIVNAPGAIRVNGVPVAMIGSITTPHIPPPFIPGAIMTGDPGVNLNG
jgi:uncharacterized Zn-binding protein involved in type VI secretion